MECQNHNGMDTLDAWYKLTTEPLTVNETVLPPFHKMQSNYFWNKLFDIVISVQSQGNCHGICLVLLFLFGSCILMQNFVALAFCIMLLFLLEYSRLGKNYFMFCFSN